MAGIIKGSPPNLLTFFTTSLIMVVIFAIPLLPTFMAIDAPLFIVFKFLADQILLLLLLVYLQSSYHQKVV